MADPIYHAQSDIEGLMPDVAFRDAAEGVVASDISAAELNTLMLHTEAEVKLKMGSYYYMDVSGTNALGTESMYVIKRICSLLTAQYVLDILRKSNVENPDIDEANREESFGKKAWRLIDGIVKYALEGYVKGAIPLTDAVSKTGRRPTIGYNISKTPINKKGVKRY